MNNEERRFHIQEINDFPDQLEEGLRSLSEEELDQSYREGGWTRRQVVHHIADSHINAYVRMRLMLTEDHPTLKPYDQDTWAELHDAVNLPVADSLPLIRSLHKRWAVLLESLSEEEWGRTAFHPEDGEVVLDALVQKYAWHGKHHLEQITS